MTWTMINTIIALILVGLWLIYYYIGKNYKS